MNLLNRVSARLGLALSLLGLFSVSAAAADTTIVVHAAGRADSQTGTFPTMELLIDNQRVQSWVVNRGNVTTPSYAQYSFVYTGNFGPNSQIKVNYPNDVSGTARDLRVDKIVVNGQTFQTEAATTLNTGTWNGTACGGTPYAKSEWLQCSGYFLYDTSSLVEPSSIVIYAAGRADQQTGTYPVMQLLIDGEVVQSWTVSSGNVTAPSYSEFRFDYPGEITSKTKIQVNYPNDVSGTARDLRVDKIVVNGQTFQTEAATTLNTGTWDGKACGGTPYAKSEWLQCSGYFLYSLDGSAPQPDPTPTVTPTPTATPTSSPTSTPTSTPSKVASPTSNGQYYYVATNGVDSSSRDGRSASTAWRTIAYAASRVPAGKGFTIRVGAGTYVEKQINLPVGVSVEGAGIGKTIVKGDSSLRTTAGWNENYALFNLKSSSMTMGNQTLKNFTIDGDEKKTHTGILVRYREVVRIENVAVRRFYFSAMWFTATVKDIALVGVDVYDTQWCASGGSWCAGAVNFGNVDRMDILSSRFYQETSGNIKALGSTFIYNLRIMDSYLSVGAESGWINPNTGHGAPAITFEICCDGIDVRNVEIANNYIDNNVSLVQRKVVWNGGTTVRMHHNTFDLTHRNPRGYPLELSMPGIEFDHNYVMGGGQWVLSDWHYHETERVKNYNIHDNFFELTSSSIQGQLLRSDRVGFEGGIFRNNTVRVDYPIKILLLREDEKHSRSEGTNLLFSENLFVIKSGVTLSSFGTGGATGTPTMKNVVFEDNVYTGGNFTQVSYSGISYRGNARGTPNANRVWTRPAFGGGTQTIQVPSLSSGIGVRN